MRVRVLGCTVLVVGLWASDAAWCQSSGFPLYVGRAVCLECHDAGHDSGACTLRAIPEHDRSFAALSKRQAVDIATISGVLGSPAESRICLDCHATAADEGRRWTTESFRVEDGVQCEACHGAGSLHVDLFRTPEHPSPTKLPELIEPGDRWRCAACHVEMPSHREVLEHGYTIPQADREYKTPINVAVSPDGRRLYVVCEHSDSLVTVDLARGLVERETPVGSRPHGVAVSPSGDRIYVTNRMDDTVSVVDAVRGDVVQEIAVGHEPHGIGMDRTGRWVFVANTGSDSLSVIDTRSMTVERRLSGGRGPWSLAIRTDGGAAVVTSVRPDPAPFREAAASEVTVLNVPERIVADRPTADEANMLQGVAFVPGTDLALVTLVRSKNLIPSTRLEQGWVMTNGLGVVRPEGRVDQVLLDQPEDYFADPMDIAVSPDGRRALVTSGGTDRVAVIDVPALLKAIDDATDRERREVLPNHLGTSSRFVIKRLAVGTNPRGVVYAPDGRFAYVACALDDSVAVIDTRDHSVFRVIRLGGPDEITELRQGERLFHSAAITFGGQFSCRSCHPDGHVNGLTFDIEAEGAGRHPVDNRTLRGIFDTPPFKWEGTNPSLSRQCGPRLAVFFTRLAPYSPEQLQALVRYMRTIKQPPNPYRERDGLTPMQRRGKAVFERTVSNHGKPLTREQQCAHCHSGAYKTNRLRADVATSMWFDSPRAIEPEDIFAADEYGELGAYYYIDSGMPTKSLDVPHLRNIHESAPYLHNGAADTLEEIWTRFNIVDRHGMTSDMTRRQLNDLIAYLKSL